MTDQLSIILHRQGMLHNNGEVFVRIIAWVVAIKQGYCATKILKKRETFFPSYLTNVSFTALSIPCTTTSFFALIHAINHLLRLTYHD